MSLIRDTYIRFQVLVHEVAKFGVVGALGFVVQLGVQNALYPGHGVGAVTAVVIGYAAATVVTFLGNRHWAFRHRKGKGIAHESALFVFFNVVGIGIATLFRLFCYRKFVFHQVRVEGEHGEEAELATLR